VSYQTGCILILIGLLAVCAIGVWLDYRRNRALFVRYRDINQPGCFMVGRDCKGRQ
jgi:hypothetical protein